MKRWLLKRTKIDTAAMARDLGIRRATAAVLANRELSSRQAARSFLYGGTAALGNPLEMKDFSQAVSLLAEAIRAGKRIAVYGDYDVDGVMSTSILYQTILRCGGNAVFYLPHRQKEGYGLNLRAVEQLAAEGIEVLFTCDNGIAALQEIALAKEKGMTVVVLDHHEPGFRGAGIFCLRRMPSLTRSSEPAPIPLSRCALEDFPITLRITFCRYLKLRMRGWNDSF